MPIMKTAGKKGRKKPGGKQPTDADRLLAMRVVLDETMKSLREELAAIEAALQVPVGSLLPPSTGGPAASSAPVTSASTAAPSQGVFVKWVNEVLHGRPLTKEQLLAEVDRLGAELRASENYPFTPPGARAPYGLLNDMITEILQRGPLKKAEIYAELTKRKYPWPAGRKWYQVIDGGLYRRKNILKKGDLFMLDPMAKTTLKQETEAVTPETEAVAPETEAVAPETEAVTPEVEQVSHVSLEKVAV
jgi:hypothetical protein